MASIVVRFASLPSLIAMLVTGVLLPAGLHAEPSQKLPNRTIDPGTVIQLVLPASIAGGQSARASLTLSGAAPPGGLHITLTSDHPETAAVPASLLIRAFERTATFDVATTARTGRGTEVVKITAAIGGATTARASASLSVTQIGPVLADRPSRSTGVSPPITTAVASDALHRRLEAAPKVTSWEPLAKIVPGGLITIIGQGFRPDTIGVTLAGRNLTLVERTPTRLVAQAPDGAGASDPYIAGPLSVQDQASQSRVLAPDFRVVDRWTGFQPTLSSLRVVRADGTFGPQIEGSTHIPRVPTPGQITFDLVVEDLPGDEIVDRAALYNVNPDARTQECNPQLFTLSVLGSQAPGHSVPYANNRLATQAVVFLNKPTTTICQLNVRLVVRYRAYPSDERVINLRLNSVAADAIDPDPTAGLVAYTVTKTGALRNFMQLSLVSSFGQCDGEVGTDHVGQLTSYGGQSKLAFRIKNGPVGTDCRWSNPSPVLGNGWLLKELSWREVAQDGCRVSADGSSDALNPHIPAQYLLKQGMWLKFERPASDATDYVPPGPARRNVVPAAIALTCGVGLADRDVVAVLDKVVLFGQPNSDPLTSAFCPGSQRLDDTTGECH